MNYIYSYFVLFNKSMHLHNSLEPFKLFENNFVSRTFQAIIKNFDYNMPHILQLIKI